VRTAPNNKLSCSWLNFLLLPNLRSFHVIGLSDPDRRSFHDGPGGKHILDPLRGTHITSLTLDYALCPPAGALQLLSLPKALRKFRLTGIFLRADEYSWITIPPFYPELGKALLPHRETLEELEVDVRWKGHKEGREDRKPTPEDQLWSLQEKYVTGCLSKLDRLRILTIHPEGLCIPTTKNPDSMIVDLLPHSLVELNLPFCISAEPEKALQEMEWIQEQVLDLIRNPREKLPLLKKIEVAIIRGDNAMDVKWTLDGACWAGSLAKKISFEVRDVDPENGWKGEAWMTPEKWFLDLSPKKKHLHEG
jgi:hypothetical protein